MGEKIRIPRQLKKPSRIARAAFQRSGAGEHSDKREGRRGARNTMREDLEIAAEEQPENLLEATMSEDADDAANDEDEIAG